MIVAITIVACKNDYQKVTEQQPLLRYQQNDQGVAIDGYSPVSYFQRNAAQKGNPQYSVTHNELTYWFTDQEQVSLFNANPSKYLPAHGGWCSLMMSGSGNLTPANPESWKIVEGKLLLFWSGDYKGTPVSGLTNWATKTDNKPDKEHKRLQDADEQWHQVLEGKATQYVIFAEKDKAFLHSLQKEQAKDASQ